MRTALLCLLVSLAAAATVAADALDEVEAGHWAYASIDALMQRGLVHGYEAGPYTGPVPMTRAEMAGIVARAVRGVGEAMQERGRRLELLAATQEEQMAEPQPSVESCLEPPPAITHEDLARIEKLLAEFRNELVTMGANVESIAAEVAELRFALAETRQHVDRVSREVARHRISGYTQLRYTVDGAASPESEFAVRRARVTLSGPLSERASYKLQVDVPSQAQVGDSAVRLTQAYAALDFPGVRLLAGQFALPFGWELFTSARDLEAPERALGVRRLFHDQRYDRGVCVEGDLGDKWRGWAAVVNGTGYKRGDTNDRKDVALRLARLHKSLEYGLSAYYGKDTTPATELTPGADAKRHLAGAHVVARRGRAEFKGEVIAGKAAMSSAVSQGDKDVLAWTVLGGYAPRPDTRLAIRFHRFDPNRDKSGDRTDVTSLVWMRWIAEAVRLRVAEEFVRPDAGGNYEIFTTELQMEY